MSQHSVERVIGLLVTDEGLRRRFQQDPGRVVVEMIENGFELNSCERRSLAALDPEAVTQFAEAIDPRLQRTEREGGGT